jgi:hypothetical protein
MNTFEQTILILNALIISENFVGSNFFYILILQLNFIVW